MFLTWKKLKANVFDASTEIFEDKDASVSTEDRKPESTFRSVLKFL